MSKNSRGDEWSELAQKTWLQGTTTAGAASIVDTVWARLEAVSFSYYALSSLESLQILESFLWREYNSNVSDRYVILLTLVANVKLRETERAWDLLTEREDDFTEYFRRALRLTLDRELTYHIRAQLLCFVISAFGTLDNGSVKKACAPLVSVSILDNVHSDEARETIFLRYPLFKKAIKASAKRFESVGEDARARLTFEKSWLYSLILTFFAEIYTSQGQQRESALIYYERIIELLIDLLSQVPTRRYLKSLLANLNFVPIVRMSPIHAEPSNTLFREMFVLFLQYYHFPIDDQSGESLSADDHYKEHCQVLSRLQTTALRIMPEQLKLLILSHYGGLSKKEELEEHVQDVTDDELRQLCQALNLRLEYPTSSNIPQGRRFLLELLVAVHEKPLSFYDTIRHLRVVPTESHLYEPILTRQDVYDGSRPIPIPKLNLQYLTVSDFLWRSFTLYRHESFYAIRQHIEAVVRAMKANKNTGETKFSGSSRMALPVQTSSVTDVVKANVGETVPSKVLVEIPINVGYLSPKVRKEWEDLKPDDVVFFAQIEPSEAAEKDDTRAHIKKVRTGEVVHIMDGTGKVIRQNFNDRNVPDARRRELRLVVKMDAHAYHDDSKDKAASESGIYSKFNLIIRRRSRENNFKPILQSMRKIALSNTPVPSWFKEVFLGYGDPASANFSRLSNRLNRIDLGDTFLDWDHLINSMPGRSVRSSDEFAPTSPPFVLEFDITEEENSQPKSKKRRRDYNDVSRPIPESVSVSTYNPPNMGPYPSDVPKRNAVKFTPAQVEAIMSGIQPGLSVIVGPPGTGKTDVATQVINAIYHNFPNERTLLIAHSNQALNQLFQKIAALDIDERHLLRLGHGEEGLELEGSYSKYGRVESFLGIGTRYLQEVTRLAQSLSAPGAHGDTCETADYFNQVYVKPAWTRYCEHISKETSTVGDIVEKFPFHYYFSNAPQPLFKPNGSKEEALEVAEGCYRHIKKVFSELESVRPFEILRNPKDQANFLLVKEARIIAMTSTHAAMRREEIVNLGFRYDNVVIEEAAQITEVETFVPLALQKPKDGDLPVKRLVLCGDHLQNSPIIQNAAFRQYAKLEQSMFKRLIRLAVPSITLDKQGRSRPSIASLYKWRYPKLGNLSHVESAPEFLYANAGFTYDYQFIDVPNFQGKGETEPSPHFIQNLGEAEYAVAIFMYMRLLGYPASKITILTTYAGQKALIRDVMSHRCAKSPLFGMPRTIATVDKYQGEQNDYIILSLVRTTRVGYLRDVRRLTVALSRARLGLYVLGRKAVFENSLELKPAFDLLFRRPAELSLTVNETHPTQRLMADRRNPQQADVQNGKAEVKECSEEEVSTPSVVIEGVEQIGQYVYEMTQAKMAAVNAGKDVIPLPESQPVDGEDDDGDVGVLMEGVNED